MFQSPDDPVKLAVDVINTWDELEPEPEQLRDVEILRRFLARRGFEEEAPRAGGRELGEVRALRDRLRAAFEVADEETAVVFLNRILGESGARAAARARRSWAGGSATSGRSWTC